MRRFLAAVLISSLPLVAAVPASAAVPARELQYAVVATSGDIVRRATVRVDFVGGSPDHIMNVALDEVDETSERAAGIGIDPKGSLIGVGRQLTSEEEALCSFISLESEDLAGVEPGDHWERQGPTPGGRYHSRFAVLTVSPDGYVDFAVSRDVQLDDGSTARWSGTMHYDAEGVVPTTIVLNGTLSGEYAGDGPRSVAISIHLTNDTFKGRAH